MAKIIELRVQIPADDGVAVQDLKIILQQHIRTAGSVVIPAGARNGETKPGELVPPAPDAIAVFSAADVKIGSPSKGKVA